MKMPSTTTKYHNRFPQIVCYSRRKMFQCCRMGTCVSVKLLFVFLPYFRQLSCTTFGVVVVVVMSENIPYIIMRNTIELTVFGRIKILTPSGDVDLTGTERIPLLTSNWQAENVWNLISCTFSAFKTAMTLSILQKEQYFYCSEYFLRTAPIPQVLLQEHLKSRVTKWSRRPIIPSEIIAKSHDIPEYIIVKKEIVMNKSSKNTSSILLSMRVHVWKDDVDESRTSWNDF